jgi:hypothetical protein
MVAKRQNMKALHKKRDKIRPLSVAFWYAWRDSLVCKTTVEVSSAVNKLHGYFNEGNFNSANSLWCTCVFKVYHYAHCDTTKNNFSRKFWHADTQTTLTTIAGLSPNVLTSTKQPSCTARKMYAYGNNAGTLPVTSNWTYISHLRHGSMALTRDQWPFSITMVPLSNDHVLRSCTMYLHLGPMALKLGPVTDITANGSGLTTKGPRTTTNSTHVGLHMKCPLLFSFNRNGNLPTNFTKISWKSVQPLSSWNADGHSAKALYNATAKPVSRWRHAVQM